MSPDSHGSFSFQFRFQFDPAHLSAVLNSHPVYTHSFWFYCTRQTWGDRKQQGRVTEAVTRGDYKVELKFSGAEPQLEAFG